MKGISVVIPSRDRAAFLDRLLGSIAKQTYGDYEVIVVDDASTDTGAYGRLAERYAGVFPSFTCLRNETNRGAPFSRNRGIMAARHDFVALVDDDDEWLPDKLTMQAGLIDGDDRETGIIYSWATVKNAEGEVLRNYTPVVEGDARREILRGCFIPSPTVLARKQALVDAGLFDESFPSCQDWDMWTRVLLRGYTCRVVKSILAIYHKHDRGSIGASPKALDGYLKYYVKHFRAALSVSPVTGVLFIARFALAVLGKLYAVVSGRRNGMAGERRS